MNNKELALQHLSSGDAAEVLDALDTPALLLDAHGVVTRFNGAWRTLCRQLLSGRIDGGIDGYLGRSYTAACSAFLALEADRQISEGIHSVLSGSLPGFRLDYMVAWPERPAWFCMTVSPLAEGVGALVTHTDVTEAKDAETSFAQLLESPMDALLVVDEHGVMKMVNARMERLFGYDRDELIGQNMHLLLPERFRARHPQHQMNFFANPHARPMGTGLELFARHRDGTEFPVEISLTPLQTAQGSLAVAAIRDVRERKVAEVQLAQLGKVLETSLNEIYLFDAETLCFTLVNRGARANLGYTMEELRVRTPLDLKPEYDRDSFEALLTPLRNGEKEELQFTTVHRRKNGLEYPVEVHLQLYQGDPKVFVAIIVDISERVRAERVLRDNEQRMALHVKRTPLAVIEWSLSDRLISAWNPAAERIFGYRADEVVGLRSADMLLVEDDPELKAVIEGRSKATSGRHTSRNRTKDGRTILCEWYNSLLVDEAGRVTGGAALVMDVTARQQAIEALLTAQDEERSRISRDLHDGVGQALTAVGLGLSRVLEVPSPGQLGDLKELVAKTLEDVRRISRDLRPALLDELGLEAAVKQFARDLSERSRTEIDILARLPQRLPRNEEAAVYRVVQEALTNVARHARATHASVVLTASDDRLHLIVEDNGVGFEVPEPSAKDGVGLVSMRERMELLGGALRLESTPGRGTIISARLPLQKQAEPSDVPPVSG